MNEYQIAFSVGVLLGLVWFCAILCSWAIQRAWAWVDDKETPYKGNWLWDKANNLGKWKYKCKNDKKYYTHSLDLVDTEYTDVTNGPDFTDCRKAVAIGIGILAVLGPLVIVIAVNFYPITIGAASFYTIAHLTRYSRRHKKAFDSHVADKKVHKKEG